MSILINKWREVLLTWGDHTFPKYILDIAESKLKKSGFLIISWVIGSEYHWFKKFWI